MPDDLLLGPDGELPCYVRVAVADNEAAAIRYAIDQGELFADDGLAAAGPILMRELDPIACKIRGVDPPYYVHCTDRAADPIAYWRIDEDLGGRSDA